MNIGMRYRRSLNERHAFILSSAMFEKFVKAQRLREGRASSRNFEFFLSLD